jgi:hypothetical protein
VIDNDNYQPHEFCLLADAHLPEELVEIEASMRKQGFISTYAIMLYENKILDGWGRYKSAKVVGVEPSFKKFHGTREEALEFARSTLFARRHCPKGRLAAIAAKYETQRRQLGMAERTHEEIAEAAGIAGSTSFVAQAMSLMGRSPAAINKVIKGETSLTHAYKEIASSVPSEATNINDKLADVWVTKEKWRLVIARLEEILARDIDPLYVRRGSEKINAAFTTKHKEGSKISLGRSMLIEQLTAIKMNMPDKPCMECYGDGCEVCGNKGWWSVAESRARRESS